MNWISAQWKLFYLLSITKLLSGYIFSQPTKLKYWSSKLHYSNFASIVIVLVFRQHLNGVPKTCDRSLQKKWIPWWWEASLSNKLAKSSIWSMNLSSEGTHTQQLHDWNVFPLKCQLQVLQSNRFTGIAISSNCQHIQFRTTIQSRSQPKQAALKDSCFIRFSTPVSSYLISRRTILVSWKQSYSSFLRNLIFPTWKFYEKACEANAAGENSSFIFIV